MATAIEAHLQNVHRAEHDRQQTAAVTQAEHKAADIRYHRERLASAIATGCSPSVSLQALRSLGAEPVAPVSPGAPAHPIVLPPIPPKPEPTSTSAKARVML